MKLALGTVQFGMNYGISNSVGQVSREEIKKILKLAAENQIDLLDTAAAYGESETLLGECLTDFDIVSPLAGETDQRAVGLLGREGVVVAMSPPLCPGEYKIRPSTGLSLPPGERRKQNHFKIISKLPDLKNINLNQADQIFQESLKKLKTESLYGLLLHNADDLLKTGSDQLYQYLLDLKNKGLVKKIGVSVYYPEQVEKLLEFYDLDLIQLPMNLFDQRFYRQGILEKLKKLNIEVHVRSVLLQGLLMMPLDKIPAKLSRVKPYLSDLDACVAKSFLNSRLALLLEFIRQTQQVDYAVLGVTSSEELKLICEAFEFFKSENLNHAEIDWSRFEIQDDNILIPSRWGN